MRLIKFCITIIFIIFHVFCIRINAQKTYDFNLMEGILIYNVDEVEDSIPLDIIFIPFQVKKNENLRSNAIQCFSEKSISYFMYFRNMRHTQSALVSYLGLMDTCDRTKFVINSRLKAVLQTLKPLNGKAIGFPSVPYLNKSNCNVEILVGAILFDKSLVDYYKKQSYFTNNPIVNNFNLNFDNSITEIKYYQYTFSDSLGMRLAFLPILLPD